ncbi:Predicted secreted endonuclease distantly related to archaeal Holliday junction resolvase [Commensalibacter communis]|uniref:Holliday junction resolvase-like protein n=1 Tax=Commensalibacter communis TaxID=2972786 RepID=UPI0022FF9002|nr:Holliday junction resolvase-like protein [Commensalibacter communis]CAI3944342.1 Predicted secreted endonuclease distantly related to archaeal Holliday junction resolvase [Commensalibacter communis]CAI3944548.1 Predicted secreted endonuclease distantly related to archaeal Holliday junction resolvase [Commensalibacter communis]CAI3945637.1 Predicted secreted endonuclease distantly related to archaeal Holliday junction resolvase [Commensalibacter communis]
MNITIITLLLIIIVLLIYYIKKLETISVIERHHRQEINALKKDPYKDMNALRAEKDKEIQVLEEKLKNLQNEYYRGIKLPIKQALTSSRNAFKREIGEIFCPFHEGFPYHPKDCTFIGNPIDYIIFNNLDGYRDGEKNIEDIEVIFFEVKTIHSAHLSKVQKAIKYAVENKKVKFKTYQYDEATINKGKTILLEKYN